MFLNITNYRFCIIFVYDLGNIGDSLILLPLHLLIEPPLPPCVIQNYLYKLFTPSIPLCGYIISEWPKRLVLKGGFTKK